MPPGPCLRRRRLGQLRPPPWARHREGRRGRDRSELRHLGSADAQPDESLGAVYAGMKKQHEVEQFLYRQADLLDNKRWQDWINLFAPSGVYWMPPDPSPQPSEGI